MDRHVQAWQGAALCGLKLEGAVRSSPLHVCISYALFPTCGCVQSSTKAGYLTANEIHTLRIHGLADAIFLSVYRAGIWNKKKGRLDRVVEWRESERKRENDRVGKRWLIEREEKNAFGFLRSLKYFRFVLRAPGAFQNRSSIIVRFSSTGPL